MRIVEVRARTVSDGITGWKGKFAAYMVIYNDGSHRFFKKNDACDKSLYRKQNAQICKMRCELFALFRNLKT